MNTEQERQDFEAFASKHGLCTTEEGDLYRSQLVGWMWKAWQARAALQSQTRNDMTLFCDLKTDEEKSAFFLSGRGYETGVIAQAIQNDVAMAYHRCAEYKKELEALQSQDAKDAERYSWLRHNAQLFSHFGEEGNSGWCVMRRDSAITRVFTYNGAELDAAIDRARSVEGGGE